MMARHEAEGTTDHAEYQGAVTILNYRHRLPARRMAGAAQALP